MLSTLHYIDRTLNAFDALDRLSRSLERDRFGGDRSGLPVNVYETDDALVLRFLVPGFSLEDLELKLEEGVLSLSGQRQVSPPTLHARDGSPASVRMRQWSGRPMAPSWMSCRARTSGG